MKGTKGENKPEFDLSRLNTTDVKTPVTWNSKRFLVALAGIKLYIQPKKVSYLNTELFRTPTGCIAQKVITGLVELLLG